MAHKITNSTVNKGSSKAQLERWYGPAQHVADGVSTDPAQESPKTGPIKGSRFKVKTGIIAAILLFGAGSAWAEGVVVKKSTCTVKWTEPQTNVDGTELLDLREYGVYVDSAPNLMVTPIAVVPAPNPNPILGAILSWPCNSLTVGQKYVQIDAVDILGQRSTRSALVPFVLEADVVDGPPSAPTNVTVQ